MAYRLTDDQVSEKIEFTKIAAELALKGRLAVPGDTVRFGKIARWYDTLTDTNETTTLVTPGTEFSEESMIEFDKASYPLWKMIRHFDLPAESIAADKFEGGSNLMENLISRTVRNMAVVEDKIFVDGWLETDGATAVSGATGIGQAAGNTHAAVLGWTAGGDPIADLLTALETMADAFVLDNRNELMILLYPSRFVALADPDAFGNTALDLIQDKLKIPSTNFLQSSSVTSTQALLNIKRSEYCDWTVVDEENFDLTDEPEMRQHGKFQRWSIFNTSGITIKETNGAYKITNV